MFKDYIALRHIGWPTERPENHKHTNPIANIVRQPLFESERVLIFFSSFYYFQTTFFHTQKSSQTLKINSIVVYAFLLR